MNNSKLLDWSGAPCVIAASGPSLSHEQITATKAARVIVTNSTWRRVESPDVIYACDFLWWKQYHQEIRQAGLHDRCWTQDRSAAERFQLRYVRSEGRQGLGLNAIRVNGNSGAGAINLAYLFGCRRILLIGFDMREVDGKKHWHPDHPAPLVQTQMFREWIHKFMTLASDLKAKGCEVVNCTPGSALQCFPMSTIERELG